MNTQGWPGCQTVCIKSTATVMIYSDTLCRESLLCMHLYRCWFVSELQHQVDELCIGVSTMLNQGNISSIPK